ncbi:hypothetical protein Nepgr_033123 [Nepenthes gracilis]|uniref:Uncharacterized protein n=1 Tax=Nepenthes gracilis TaxID=150966 RepID=A0AAD3TJY6_NEPGR|nr:hypothetical protein Nepgr_033123 [Nepenthes gracilis]
MFGQSDLHSSPQIFAAKEPVIQEVNTDDEGEGEIVDGNIDDHRRSSSSSKEPFVVHPDDEVDDGNRKDVCGRTNYNLVPGTQAQTFKFHSCKVTHGGVDGAYYTSSGTRRIDSGVLMEEWKEADRITGQATHRISRGMNDKGHSITRKLNSDGKVETLQTLHNLNEDELTGFEKAWKDNAEKNPLSWTDAFSTRQDAGSSSNRRSDQGGWLLPFVGPQTRPWAIGLGQNDSGGGTGTGTTSSTSAGRTKKVVRINID